MEDESLVEINTGRGYLAIILAMTKKFAILMKTEGLQYSEKIFDHFSYSFTYVCIVRNW